MSCKIVKRHTRVAFDITYQWTRIIRGNAMKHDSSSDSDTSSDSSRSSSDDEGARIVGALRRSYLPFSVSQDWQNQSILGASQFAKLDLYQIDALRDDNEDPFGTKKEMQCATRHFPCHVFWSKMIEPNKYSIWGRRTVGEGEQEAVIAMLEAQRAEREEYLRLKEERRWKLVTERKVREFKMAKSESLAMARSDARRASEARAQADPAPKPTRSQTRRIASIVHRIVRRSDSEDLTEERASSLLNRGLARLGIAALAAGGLALTSAMMYFHQLQETGHDEELLAPPEFPALAARIDNDPMASVTDRVFAMHMARTKARPVRTGVVGGGEEPWTQEERDEWMREHKLNGVGSLP